MYASSHLRNLLGKCEQEIVNTYALSRATQPVTAVLERATLAAFALAAEHTKASRALHTKATAHTRTAESKRHTKASTPQ